MSCKALGFRDINCWYSYLFCFGLKERKKEERQEGEEKTKGQVNLVSQVFKDFMVFVINSATAILDPLPDP